MTWMELLRTERHELPPEKIALIDCPGTEGEPKKLCPVGEDGQTLSCEACWAREVPEDYTGDAAALTPPEPEAGR